MAEKHKKFIDHDDDFEKEFVPEKFVPEKFVPIKPEPVEPEPVKVEPVKVEPVFDFEPSDNLVYTENKKRLFPEPAVVKDPDLLEFKKYKDSLVPDTVGGVENVKYTKRTVPEPDTVDSHWHGAMTMKVQALDNFKNGMLEEHIQVWERGEIKEITAVQYKQLMSDLPTNWVVLNG